VNRDGFHLGKLRRGTPRKLVAVGLLSGCWTSAAPQGEPAAIAPTAVPRDPFPLHSVWRGTYRCNQGLSAVKLTIDAKPSGEAVARFDFGPVESNPNVPEGAFELAGTLRATSDAAWAGEFEAARWIVQPDGYFMVGLGIATAGPRRLRGAIVHPTCADFKATRVD
jgi:hypothetical protein